MPTRRESPRRTLRLEEYRFRRCDRSFYIGSADHGSLELDFSCPYGCDDWDVLYECACDAMADYGGD